MTRLSVVSALSILPDGSIDFGEQDIKAITIGDVKRMVTGQCEDDALFCREQPQHRLWWHGYLLDDDDLTLSKACVGVNPGETWQENEKELVLFLTAHEEEEDNILDNDMDSSFSSLSRLRSNSLTKLQTEIRKQQETITSNCVVM